MPPLQHDITGRRLSQTPDGCALYIAGPVIASKGNQVATVDSLQNYELLHDGTGERLEHHGLLARHLHIGGRISHRLPGVSFHNSQNGLHVMQFKGETCCPSQWGVMASTGVEFIAGETYDIKVVVQSNQMTVYVDDISVGTAFWERDRCCDERCGWVGDPWSQQIAKVTLSDITLSEVALADTCRENIAATTTYRCRARLRQCLSRAASPSPWARTITPRAFTAPLREALERTTRML